MEAIDLGTHSSSYGLPGSKILTWQTVKRHRWLSNISGLYYVAKPTRKIRPANNELLPPDYPPLPITREPGGNSWVISDRVALPVAFGLQEGSTRNTQVRISIDGLIPLQGWRGCEGDTHFFGKYECFPWWRQHHPTDIPEALIVQVRENKTCASAPPTGKSKIDFYLLTS